MIPAPVTAPPELRSAVEIMLEQLRVERLEVGLVPAPEQQHMVHCVRAVLCANPSWYRELAATYQRHRRARKDRYVDPVFKRADVERALRLLLTTGTRSWLAGPLLAAASAVQQRESVAMAAYWPFDLPEDLAAMGVAV